MIPIPPSGVERQFAKNIVRDLTASTTALSDVRAGKDVPYFPSLVTADQKASAGLVDLEWLRKIQLVERGATQAYGDAQRAVLLVRGLRTSPPGLTPDVLTRLGSAIDLLTGSTELIRKGYSVRG